MPRRSRIRCPVYVEGEDTVPHTGIKVKWEFPQYREEQERTWMPPQEFLRLVPSPGRISRSSYDAIREMMTTGSVKGKKEEFLSPYLEVEERGCRVTGHEGRHRAFWFLDQNLPCMPVLLTHMRKNRHVKATVKCEGSLKPDLQIRKVIEDDPRFLNAGKRAGSALELARSPSWFEP